MIDCRGYRVPAMRPEHCLDNQLSIFCLPGWPCHGCRQAVGVGIMPTATDPSPRPSPLKGERE